MKISKFTFSSVLASLVWMAGISTPAYATFNVAQAPLYLKVAVPPLNMLVLGKDHKNYYEAYNDASDLNGDGELDVGYKPDEIDYYGYFNSRVCYSWNSGSNMFTPSSAASGTNGKRCSGMWSGDFLNYLTTGRLDALRKVLYGGYRNVDTASQTVLQGAFFPQDAHSWGKEYQSIARDGYNIADYAPLGAPGEGRYHLFAVTTVTDNSAPLFRVQPDTPFRVWNWVSKEGPVANLKCLNSIGATKDCNSTAIYDVSVGPGVLFTYPTMQYSTWKTDWSAPAIAGNKAQLNTAFSNYATPSRLCGSGSLPTSPTGTDLSRIYQDWYTPETGNTAPNPFTANSCDSGSFLSEHLGTFVPAVSGSWTAEITADHSAYLEVTDQATGTLITTVERYNRLDNSGDNSSPSTSSKTFNLVANNTYIVRYRTQTYQWRNGGTQRVRWRPNVAGTAGIQDYKVRVEVCPSSSADLREETCKQYPDGNWKPTGILHDYGEEERMYFGLITGTQANNIEGGVLRSNVSSFANEVNSDNGTFNSAVLGIAKSLDKLRMIGGGYAGGTVDNSTSNSNWGWGNGTGNCASQGDRAINNGECRMWGNPIGEMMFESLRYFAGAQPHPGYATGGSTQGQGEDSTLGLPTPAWKDPYGEVSIPPAATDGLGFASCAKPVMTVISDINPSYDSNLPGGWSSPTFTLPSNLTAFNMGTVGQSIWNAEFGGSRTVFIGDNGTTDGAPTAKNASSFGNIRGLSPEEPSKEGSFSSSAVSYFGWTNPLKANSRSVENVRTYSVALASPLPRIEFPVGEKLVSFVPFAKTAGGTFGGGTRKPTNTIVDFYVEEYANFPGQPLNMSINSGRAYAIFRINYEDVEQGNDHDMDAIVRYEAKANADGTLTMTLKSEYAAGSAIQHMGYVVSGTDQDGVYLEVRDSDTALAASPSYRFNTPPGRSPGYCAVATPPADCAGLPLVATRTFTPSTTASSATQLRDPLWYAAKFGGFNDDNLNGVPDNGEWDDDLDGNPDNYFLVTNASRLRQQLDEAFDQIIQDASPTGGVAASGTRRDAGFMVYIPEYKPVDWTGSLKAFRTTASGGIGALVWNASDKLAAVSPAARNIFATVKNAGDFELVPFELGDLGGATAAEALLDIGISDYAAYGGTADVEDVIDWLRGDMSLATTASDPLRARSSKLGDILNSQPGITTKASFGYTTLPASMGGGNSGSGSYGAFLRDVKEVREPVIFVGANDGMLHAFSATETGGDELFAVIPNSVLGNLKELPKKSYQHRYYVDSSPVIADARLGGTWKTVLLYSTGAGGTSVSALDVTNAAAGFDENDFLWEFQHADMGLAMVSPQVLLLADGTWAALFGNGVNSANHRGKVFLVDLEDGSVISEIYTGTAGSAADSNGVMSVAAADTDFDGFPDTAYAGDLHGKLWKLNVGADGSLTIANSGSPMFTAEDDGKVRQMITGGIEIALHHIRGQMVFFGTGKYFEVGDNAPVADPQVQTFYGIWDDPDHPGEVDRVDLMPQTIDGQSTEDGYELRSVSDEPVDWSSQKGWYLNLQVRDARAKGERFIGTPRVELGNAIFTTFTSLGDECDPGGENWLYVLNAITGARSLDLGSSGAAGAVLAGTGAPAVAPPIVTTPPETECRPGIDAGCDIMGEDEDGNACVYGEPGCDTLSPSAGAGCTSDVGLVLSTGIRRFATLSCGRQSWRQMQ